MIKVEQANSKKLHKFVEDIFEKGGEVSGSVLTGNTMYILWYKNKGDKESKTKIFKKDLDGN